MFNPQIEQNPTAGSTLPLPAPPPKAKKASLFDDDHRRQTLLTLAASLVSGRTLGDSLSGAFSNLSGLQGQLQAEQRKTREFGGPDNSFEIITDPKTGERTYQPVEPFQTYLKDKATKPKDTADMNGRVMFALQQLPEEQRAAAYAGILANPDRYGVDPATMPPAYDPQYADLTAGIGMNVSQALTRQQAASNARDLRDYRGEVQQDRETRTGIYRDRAAATTSQGERRLAISASKGRGSGGKGGRGLPRAKPKSNSDLSYLLQ